uniref:Secreted protein n=1 Tax=Oryzias sinensis TaxID=183150 RepID=A0A8C7Y9R6_9TELE
MSCFFLIALFAEINSSDRNCIVVSTYASQQLGPGSIPSSDQCLCKHCFFYGNSDFLPQSEACFIDNW